MEHCYFIIGIRVEKRVQSAVHIQEVLTRHGSRIRARLGLHDVGGRGENDDGLVILQVCGEKSGLEQLTGELNGLDGVKARLIDLS